MNLWQREVLAVAVLALLVAISHLQVTVTEADCDCLQEGAVEAITSFSEEELQAALLAGKLTEDQCMWMHEQRINWQIDVERN